MKTLDYLQALKAVSKKPTVYSVAQLLELPQATVRSWAKGRRFPDPYACARIAEVLDLPLEQVVSDINAECEKDEGRKAYWQGLARKFAPLGLVGICTLIGITGGTWPSSASAASSTESRDNCLTLYKLCDTYVSHKASGTALERTAKLPLNAGQQLPSLPMPFIQPVTLQSPQAHLVPLTPDHHDGLVAAARDGELWNLWYTTVPSPEAMRADIDRRLGQLKAGNMLPFVVLDPASGQVAGSTNYLNVDVNVRRVEIGGTWYRAASQRTALNTGCKLLLLKHAFEVLDCVVVEFRTHFLNQASRRGIERLGAKFDGILRNHMRMPNGTLRDTCVYSITAPEWPTVKAHLEFQLSKPRP